VAKSGVLAAGQCGARVARSTVPLRQREDEDESPPFRIFAAGRHRQARRALRVVIQRRFKEGVTRRGANCATQIA
jgi:hypothetical protein